MTERFRRASAMLACLLVGIVAGTPAVAQANPETDPLNHAYAVYLGSGVYVIDGQSAFIFRIAPKFRLRSEEEHAFGIRMRINATLGFYNFDPADLLELEFPDRVGSFALIPGIEFPIRIYDNWTLMPFLDAGLATDTGFQDKTVVVGTGIRSRSIFRDRRFDYILWAELIAAQNHFVDQGNSEGYTVLRTDLDMRKLIKYRLFKQPFDFGLLARTEWYFDPVVSGILKDEPININQRYEIGFTTGPTEKWKQLWNLATVPRLGISYRFGDDLSAVVFLFRFRN